MKAIGIEPGAENSLAMMDVPDPQVGDLDALVRVLRVGVCGTDMELKAGTYGDAPSGSPYLLIGHEAIGQVVEVGSHAEDISVGDFVVATVRRPCPHGHCFPCRTGQNDMCVTGDYSERGIKGMHGFLSEYYSEQVDRLTKVPPHAVAEGVLLEPLSIVEKALRQTFSIQDRLPWKIKKAMVLGAGAIGLLAAMLLRLRGIDTYVLDRSESGGIKSHIITKIGGSHFDSTKTRLSEIASNTGQFDFILEATGYAPLIFEAEEHLAMDGVLCMLGVSGESGESPVDAGQFNNRFVLGNRLMFGSVNANLVDFRNGVGHLEQISGEWPGVLQRLVTKRVPFSRFESAYERQPGEVKVTIEMDS